MRHRHSLTKYQQARLDQAFAKADREAALRKQDGLCKYCLCRLSYRTVTRDHVKPRSAGGGDNRNNVVAACAPCNRAKGSIPFADFMRLITDPRPGEPFVFRMIWVDRRLNAALHRMRKNLLRAVGVKL